MVGRAIPGGSQRHEPVDTGVRVRRPITALEVRQVVVQPMGEQRHPTYKLQRRGLVSVCPEQVGRVLGGFLLALSLWLSRTQHATTLRTHCRVHQNFH